MSEQSIALRTPSVKGEERPEAAILVLSSLWQGPLLREGGKAIISAATSYSSNSAFTVRLAIVASRTRHNFNVIVDCMPRRLLRRLVRLRKTRR